MLKVRLNLLLLSDSFSILLHNRLQVALNLVARRFLLTTTSKLKIFSSFVTVVVFVYLYFQVWKAGEMALIIAFELAVSALLLDFKFLQLVLFANQNHQKLSFIVC